MVEGDLSQAAGMSLTEISGKTRLLLFPILLDPNFDDGRTKDMACISKSALSPPLLQEERSHRNGPPENTGDFPSHPSPV